MSSFDNDSSILTIKSGLTVYTGKVEPDHFPQTIRKKWNEIVAKSLTNMYKTHTKLGLIGTDTPSIISSIVDEKFFQIKFILDSTHAYIDETITIPLEKSIVDINKLVENYEAKIMDLTKKYEDKVAECEQLKKQLVTPQINTTNLFIDLLSSITKEVISPQPNPSVNPSVNPSDSTEILVELITSLAKSSLEAKSK
jgi:hypothetical protein